MALEEIDRAGNAVLAGLAAKGMAFAAIDLHFVFGADLLQQADQFAGAGQRHGAVAVAMQDQGRRSEEHTFELQSLMRISYAVFCLKKQKEQTLNRITHLAQ